MPKDGKSTAEETANLESLDSADFATTIQEEQYSEALQPPSFSPECEPNASRMDELRSIARGKKEGYMRRAYKIKIRVYPDGEPENQLERDYKRFCRGIKRDIYNSNQELREIGQAWGIGLGDIQALFIDADAILTEAAQAEKNPARKISLFEQIRH